MTLSPRFSTFNLIDGVNDVQAAYEKSEQNTGAQPHAVLLGAPSLAFECLRAAMGARGIQTTTYSLDDVQFSNAHDVVIIFLPRWEPELASGVKKVMSGLRGAAARTVPSIALIEQATGIALHDLAANFSTIVVGLPSVNFAVDAVQDVLRLRPRQLARCGNVVGESQPLVSAAEVSDHATEAGLSTLPKVCFTRREIELLDLLRRGKQNKLIAYELGISLSTVKAHLRSIMMKLKAKNRTEAVCLLQGSDHTGEATHA